MAGYLDDPSVPDYIKDAIRQGDDGQTLPRGAGWNAYNWASQTQGRGRLQRNPFAQPGSDREDYWLPPHWRQYLDPITGTPLSGLTPDELIAPEAQLGAEAWARYRRNQLYGRGQNALRMQQNYLTSRRPGSAVGLLSPIASQRASMYAQQASQTEAPDLMFRYREWLEQKRQKAAQKAKDTQVAVAIGGAVLTAVTAGLASPVLGLAAGAASGIAGGLTGSRGGEMAGEVSTAAAGGGMAAGGMVGAMGGANEGGAYGGDSTLTMQAQGTPPETEGAGATPGQPGPEAWKDHRFPSSPEGHPFFGGSGGDQGGQAMRSQMAPGGAPGGPGGPMGAMGGMPGSMPPQTRAMHSGGPGGFDMTSAPAAAARTIPGALEDDLYATVWALEDDEQPFSLGELMNGRLDALTGSMVEPVGMGY